MKEALFVLALLLGGYWWMGSEITRPPGVLIADRPVQREIHSQGPRQMHGYRLTPLASFEIRARVIGTERYFFDRGAALAPVDLALGWGPMSDTAVLKKLSFSQGGRFYRWWTQEFPIPRRDIEIHSANMHMIPANGTIERGLKAIRPGHLVHVMGYLVEVSGEDGFRWKSSLSREDAGGGACELVLVESLSFW
jgi:hypothetical protein